ncbi:MAG: HAD-IIA family hydrolase [Bacteroidales bacterium]|nr:HAD-IIA family hydrolase [Bacteroidales bacterium]MBN2819182.1 HAD-IIA family hydrolase [Bacteroidales bacterium]
MKTKDFKKVVLKYKAVFFDAYGVLKNYKGLIPGIENTFQFLIDNGIDYYILTNDASRSPEQLADTYRSRGITAVTTERIISSGMLAREYLQYKIKHGTVVYLGTKNSAHYIESSGLTTLSVEDANLEELDHVRAMVFLDDEGFVWNNDINKVINILRHKNMSVIVANTDISYPVNKHEIAIAIGGLADLVEEIIGKVFIRFGKPDAQMFMYAYEQVLAKSPMRKDEILMVGDTLKTDIIGGNKFGLDTALVLTGNTIPDQASMKIASSGIIPTHICESVVIN